MTISVIVASTSSTVRKMVGISLANVPCELVMVNSGAKLIQRMAQTRVGLVIVGESLAGDGTRALIEQIADNANEKGTAVLVLRNRGSSFAVQASTQTQPIAYLELPAMSQVIVEEVSALLGLDVADQGLYAPYRVAIPLANPVSGERLETDVSRDQERPSVEDELPTQEQSVVDDSESSSEITEDLNERNGPSGHTTTQADFKSIGQSHFKTQSIPSDMDGELTDRMGKVVEETSSFGLVPPVEPPEEKIEHVMETVTDAVSHELLGLDLEQNENLRTLVRETVERVVWDIVPELAEAMIKEEIDRLLTSKERS